MKKEKVFFVFGCLICFLALGCGLFLTTLSPISYGKRVSEGTLIEGPAFLVARNREEDRGILIPDNQNFKVTENSIVFRAKKGIDLKMIVLNDGWEISYP